MTAVNAFGRQVIDYLTNKSGGGVIAGDVVVIDSSNDQAFTTTTSAGFTGGVGIAQETIANNAAGRVLRFGYASLVNVNASVTRGQYGKTHTVAKQATGNSVRTVGTFCQFLTGGTTPTATLFPVDLLGTSLSNPMTTTGDIIYSSDNSGTPARLAAGTSGKILTAAGAGVSPAWGQGPLTTTGDLLIGATGGTPTRLAVGTSAQFLQGGTTPAWASPPGTELDYAQITSNVSVTGTTEGTSNTVITGGTVAYDGSTIVIIEFFSPYVNTQQTANAEIFILLYEDTNIVGWFGTHDTTTATLSNGTPVLCRHRRTPSNASHQYIIKAYTTSGTSFVKAGSGGTGAFVPAYLRVTKV